ncbi:MAG: HAMP domain-containing histidine kinase [Spirochaetes bacterium]|nr:HAMP domain-containing histidine kinase [Spirochaetota bacterium]
MKRIFYFVFASIAASLFLSLIVMFVTFRIGYVRSSRAWGDEKSALLEESVVRIIEELLLLDRDEQRSALIQKLDPLVPPGVSIVVYDADRRPLYSHTRGRGRMGGGMMHQNGPDTLALKTVRVKGDTVGYYGIGTFGFGADRASMRFLESMRKTVAFSLGAAAAIAILFSLFVSRMISKTARTVSDGIDEMARGNLSVSIPERGTQEISRIAKAANELAAKLEREEQIRSQWAADVAHDLKTPVAALRSQLEGMSDGVLAVTAERIKKNLNELARIEALVSDLGELTRLESPRMAIHPKGIDAGAFLDGLKDRFSPQMQKKGITAEWVKETDDFFGDENLLARAFSNILSNAVRHTPQNGTVTVSVRTEGAGYELSVHNTGEAIPPEEIKKVFDRLYRGEYARNTPGSGLGLTIAKKIAQLHGGDVSIASEEQKGTTVRMRIKKPSR